MYKIVSVRDSMPIETTGNYHIVEIKYTFCEFLAVILFKTRDKTNNEQLLEN